MTADRTLKKHPSGFAPVALLLRYFAKIVESNTYALLNAKGGQDAVTIGIFDKGGIPLGICYYSIGLACLSAAFGCAPPHVINKSFDAFR
jgi:hypothetical protein